MLLSQLGLQLAYTVRYRKIEFHSKDQARLINIKPLNREGRVTLYTSIQAGV